MTGDIVKLLDPGWPRVCGKIGMGKLEDVAHIKTIPAAAHRITSRGASLQAAKILRGLIERITVRDDGGRLVP